MSSGRAAVRLLLSGQCNGLILGSCLCRLLWVPAGLVRMLVEMLHPGLFSRVHSSIEACEEYQKMDSMEGFH